MAENDSLKLVSEGADAISDFFPPELVASLKGVKLLASVRERLLARKLEAFLSEPALNRSFYARNLRSDILRDEERTKQVGETFLMILERVTDFNKPVLLGKVAAAYLSDEIDANAALRLAHAIDISSALDLQAFLAGKGSLIDDGTLWPARLAGVGLVSMLSSGALSGGDLENQVAPLGTTLLHVVEYCNIAAP